MDSVTGVLTSESFTIKYHHDADALEFGQNLVLRQNYDLSLQRNWRHGDRIRTVYRNRWYEGKLGDRVPSSATYPNSLFLCCRIKYISFGQQTSVPVY